VGLVLVLLLVGGGGLRIWFRQQPGVGALLSALPSFQQATQELTDGLTDGAGVSVRFASDLRAGRWHEAYESTSDGFRKTVDEAAFTRFMKDAPPLKGPNIPVNFNVIQVSSGSTVTFQGGQGWRTLTY
jgi:hypothetical protein